MMNITDYKKAVSELKAEWDSSYNNPSDFIFDGATDDDLWFKSKWRLMVLLKEAHGGGRWDHNLGIKKDNGLFRVGGTANQATHYRVLEWLYSFESELDGKPYDVDYERNNDYTNARQTMLHSAWVNIKKADGNPNSAPQDLFQVIRRDTSFLRRQIDLLSPKVVICCGTFGFVKDALFANTRRIDGTNACYATNDVIVVDFRHPARASRESYMDLAKEAHSLHLTGLPR